MGAERLANAARNSVAIEPRQSDVDEGNARAGALDGVYAALAVVGGDDFVSGALEDRLQQQSIVFLVLDEDEPSRCGRSPNWRSG